MPSIFTRARTTSTKNTTKNSLDAGIDEFGRVQSRGPPQPPLKDKRDRERARTQSQVKRATNQSEVDLELDTELEDGFLPTSLNEQADTPDQEYGYLSHAAHVVLAVEDVERLVEVAANELIQRGLTTPFLFSNTALDLSSPAVRRLIASFLRMQDFRDEARFANPHALASFLRWGLARPVRIVSGIEHRGFISWETYLHWRHIEHTSNFSKTEFSSFIGLLAPNLRSLLLTLLNLLSRLLANSTSSGLTPPTLASLFGPLLFGLGPPSSSFHTAYAAYLRAAHATEHILLSYVRLQISQAPPSAPPPRRLVSWVQGYPATLAPLDSFERPRLGARTRRVASVRRNVRLYTDDLVRMCAGWARGAEGAAVRASKEWGRIAPEKRDGSRMEPRYSDAYRKKLDLPPGFRPSSSTLSPSASSPLSTPALSTASSSASTRSSLFDDPAEEAKFRSLTDMKWGEFSMLGFGDGAAAPSALQFDLTEGARSARSAKRQTLNWNDFSAAGFSRGDASLTETLQFAPPLAQTVQSWPAAEKEMHKKLKKNVQKALPPFGWDTAPVMDGREDVIEEGFLDVFCDLLYGGWMERGETTFRDCNWALVEFRSLPSSRSEVSATSPSLTLTSSTDPNAPPDPRTASTLLLFEEFVPAEYRTSLLKQGSKPTMRTRLGIAALLSSKKNAGTGKQWKQAATLNGRPYAVGAVPMSPGQREREREAEFERMLGGGGTTKVLSLAMGSSATVGHSAGVGAASLRVQTPVMEPRRSMTSPVPTTPINNSTSPSQGPSGPLPPPPPAKSSLDSPGRTTSPFSTSTLRKPRFRFPGGGGRENRGMIPSEYESVDFDFDTRFAGSDEEVRSSAEGSNGKNGNGKEGKAGPAGEKRAKERERRMSKDDAWVDILVASSGKRMGDQDAEMRPRGMSGAGARALGGSMSAGAGAGTSAGMGTGKGMGRSDPELASMEVAQALAAVRQLSPASDDDDGETSRGSSPHARIENGNGNGNGHGNGYDEEEADDDSPPKRRLGYFDLHPERRPAGYEEPGRASLSASAYGDSMYSEGDFEPAGSIMSGEGDIEVPAFVEDGDGEGERMRRREREGEGVRAESMVLPSQRESQQSKTASLIEMYRERERLASSSGQVVPATTPPLQIQKPSRLPVRTSSLPHDDQIPIPIPSAKGQAKITATPAASSKSTPVPPSASLDEVQVDEEEEVEEGEDEDDIESLEPAAPYVLGELGRSSPMRYVHGAPLHNVLEEGEEEE